MNYSFTNKNKRNKYKQFCENYSKFYFNFLIINNLFKIKNIILEKKIIYLILQLIAAKLKTGYPHQLLSVSTPFFFQFFMDSVMSCLISDLSFPSAKASSL